MRFTIAAVAASLLAYTGHADALPGKSKWSTGFAKEFTSRGRNFIGTALTLRNPPDEQEAAIYNNRNDFNSFTPENAMKWESTQPARNNFTFADADAFIKYARGRDYQTHCHTLVWHSQLPDWVTNGGFDNATLIQVMKEHIQAVVGRYKGQCTRWDVVNEALNEDGTYRESVWYNTIGEAYIPIAFKFVKQVDSKAKLFYNDYNLEYNNNKTAAAAKIVKLVRQYGAKIDGVGFQCHVASETTPTSPGPAPDLATLSAALKSITSLKANVAYTEIDVRMNTPATPEKLQVQANTYQRIAESCLGDRRCEGMTLWGVSDKYSWIPGVFAGEGAALVWNETYAKKPAYAGFLKGIKDSRCD